jgi:hypothetical protein
MKALAGIAIVALHAAAFVAIASRSDGTELAIELRAPQSLDGTPPAAIADRVTTTLEIGPGLARRRWSITYRGGHTREVGATQLVGPFQDPAAPPCSGRVIVGQRLLDDGRPGSIADAMAKALDDELRGTSVVGAGDYLRLENFRLRWAQIEVHLFDRALLGDAGAPHGYLRATAHVVFERVRVPIVLALVPEPTGATLGFRIAAQADLELDNHVLQWLSDQLGGGWLASRIARHEIDRVLTATLAPPPPFELSEGQELQFTYCDGPVEITEGGAGVLPFAVTIRGAAPEVLPPRMPAGAPAAPTSTTTLALDLDLSALDAMLYELWRTGWLDRRLAEVGLDRRFNADPTVMEMLSIRVSPLRLALPPVVSASAHGGLRLAAEARLSIHDGDTATVGRAYGAVEFKFIKVNERSRLSVSVDLGALELACERAPTTLVPCYADLVAALRDRGAEFHGALTDAFSQLLAQIFVERRLGAAGLPAELAIRGVTPTLIGSTLHLELDAAIVAK